MENINLRAVILAITLLIFTYSYYVREPGSIMSIWTVVALGIVAVVLFFIYFFTIKLINYNIQAKIYPNIALHIILPFMVITILSWLVYAIIYMKPFGITGDFLALLKVFFTKHVLFIAICAIAIGLTLSFPQQKVNTNNQLLWRNNLIFLASSVLVFLLCISFFYFTKKIKQPQLDAKYKHYQNLKDIHTSGSYEVSHLIAASKYNYVEKPYLLPYKDELILIATYASSNTRKPIQTIYRLNKDGDIIEKIKDDELTDNEFFPIVAIDGILTDYSGKELITWIFNGNRKRHININFMLEDNWVIDTLQENAKLSKVVHFQKTSAFHCNDIKDLRYNGTKYYEVKQQNEVLKIKIDSVYSHNDNIENCDEKKLAYYTSDRLNFSLLCLNDHDYYIVNQRKNR